MLGLQSTRVQAFDKSIRRIFGGSSTEETKEPATTKPEPETKPEPPKEKPAAPTAEPTEGDGEKSAESSALSMQWGTASALASVVSLSLVMLAA